jgi:hypothetical protein
MFAIKAELKTKGLVLGNGPLLYWAFMKFRGPQALLDIIKGRPFLEWILIVCIVT